ncbi:MAG TPA: 2OG-Fe(II) oxygenase [Pyrinomonadaceae bacterium]|jgi:hypothetical protein|nr:2OG-Fe(II) oxygenase [Pyrinomonadaceae bacterium]
MRDPRTIIHLPDAEDLSQTYASGDPFPHIELDGLVDEEALEGVLSEFPRSCEEVRAGDYRDDPRSQIKWRSNWQSDADIPPHSFNLIQALNSGDTLRFLEKLTGVPHLLCDPYLGGGGLNETRRGGLLHIHSDGNRSDALDCFRALNVILFLNRGWLDEWGGHLELWDRNLTGCVKRIRPEFNKMVVFTTNSESYHGHPPPLRTPEDVTRRSLILYYYTSRNLFDRRGQMVERHSAQWQYPSGT